MKDKCECCGTTKKVHYRLGAQVDLCDKCCHALWVAEQEEQKK